MKIKLILIALLSLSLTGFIIGGTDSDSDFSGSFLLGYRAVDLSANSSLNKYKEDINLEDGARLFNFNLHLIPEGKLKNLFDRFDFVINNFGGDPFESMSISFSKYGKYNFKYDRRKATYFYNDVLLGGDDHTFNFDRVIDNGSLKFWLSKKMRVFIDFNRYTKKGDSTTTLDISHEEYELDKTVDESSNELSIGVDFTAGKFNFLLMEKIQDYKNGYEVFLPGFSLGEDQSAGNVEELNYFFLNQPYDFRNLTHSLKVTGRPSDNFLLRASFQYSDQNMRLTYSEAADGVAYTGKDLYYAYNGDGSVDRTMGLYDIDISYLLNNKTALTGAVRYHNFDQSGIMTIDESEHDAALKYNTFGIEAGLNFQLSKKLNASLGIRNELRNVTLDAQEDNAESLKTTRTGLFGNVKFDLSRSFRTTLDYQYGTYKDPFTMISPKDFHRVRFTGKYKASSFFLKGSLLFNKVENNVDADWYSDKFQVNVRTGLNKKNVYFSLGYGLIDVRHDGTRSLSGYGVSSPWEIFFQGKSHLIDAYLHLKFSEKVNGGAYINYYLNKGTWELKRVSGSAFLNFNFSNNLISRLAFKYVDYNEVVNGFNDYVARIIEFSIGYSWK